MSASKTSKYNGHMLALQDDQDIKATRRARAIEARLYRGGRDSDSDIRMINATGGISNMAQERWRNLTPNLSKPFAYRTMPLSTVTYAKSKSVGKATRALPHNNATPNPKPEPTIGALVLEDILRKRNKHMA
jgi:hypothetical protein